MKATVIRKAQFNAAHRLFRSDWSDDKNRDVFGLCSNPNFHGHNYQLEVLVNGEIDPETGFVLDLKELKTLIDEEVMEPFDHRNLNRDTKEFQTLNPTAENIAVVIWQKLRKRLDARFDLKIRLHETERNVVEFDGQ
ncbi:MAG TPA: 6-carboxytetrahydropterin synthase [Chitinophagales bacterium]|nr:6-carboxytetrahydropterin synthase [Chitinophagales bacterium]